MLGYESAAEALSERFHMSPKLLAELNPGRALGRLAAGDTLLVANLGDAAPTGARSVRIDKSARVLFVMGNEEKILASFPISIGGPKDPLPLGRMKSINEVENPSFTFDPVLIKSAKPEALKTEIKPGPNNPVGNVGRTIPCPAVPWPGPCTAFASASWATPSTQRAGRAGAMKPWTSPSRAADPCMRSTTARWSSCSRACRAA